MDIYTACAVQPVVKAVKTRADAKSNIKRCLELIKASPQMGITAVEGFGSDHWAPVKLVCFPEFTFTGHESTWPMKHYLDNVVVEIPGEETEAFAEKAREYQIYISLCALEKTPELKDWFWNTEIVIDPKGRIVHTYHKFTPAAHWELSVSPHDVYDFYVEKYGDSLSSFFPVTETEIGKIGTNICMDGHYPESARALGVQGAEIVIHPSFADPMMSPPFEIWQALNKMRAWENCAYNICPCRGRLEEALRPECIQPGKSMIVKYDGSVIAYADFPGETIVSAVINLEELRRRRTSMSRNFLPTLRTEVYRKIYENSIYPANQFMGRGPNSRAQRDPKEVLKDFFKKGIFVKPEKMPDDLK
jgi:predicted amidohydrolase